LFVGLSQFVADMEAIGEEDHREDKDGEDVEKKSGDVRCGVVTVSFIAVVPHYVWVRDGGGSEGRGVVGGEYQCKRH
jgi:hypothetical protein